MALRIGGQVTVADQALFALRSTQFLDQNYDRFNAFCRAMKVFQKCFLHYRSFNENMYRQMNIEFFNAMIDFYGVRNDQRIQNFGQIMVAIDQTVRTEPMIITFGVTELVSNETLTNARVTIELGHTQHHHNRQTLNLNVSQKDQNSSSYQIIRYDDIDFAVINDRQIVITYTDSVVANEWRNFEPFVIPYRRLHHEGFHQKLRFGSTLILFSIELKSNEGNYNQLFVNSFHLHTIMFAIQNRLTHLRAQPPDQQYYRHTDPTHQRRITYDVGLTDPTTRDAFWGTPPNVTQNMQNFCRVKYCDFQIGFEFGEELVDQSLCTCNEFCNLNAFFHYNPIYRFLLVQHNRHYVRNKTIVGNLYEMALTLSITTMNPIGLAPLFNLLNSSSERVTKNRLIFDTKPGLKNDWRHSTPHPGDMEGFVYISLFNCNLSDIMAANYGQVHFDENAFAGIANLMERLFEMHSRIAYDLTFVEYNQKDDWFREFEYRSRKHYYTYLTYSMCRSFQALNSTFEENLFTRDYEVTAHPSTNAQTNQIFRWRRIEHRAYPQNVKLETRCFTHTINQLWLSVTRFEPSTGLYSRTGLREQFNMFCRIHDSIDQMLKTPNFEYHKTRVQLASDQALQAQGLMTNTRLLFIHFFKLKVYSKVFQIQNKFLDALFKYNKKSHTMRQGFAFQAFWNDFWIEGLPSTRQPLPNIFTKNNTFVASINNFYNTFWLPPDHQTLAQGQGVVTRQNVQDSVFNEYAKRRYWDRIDGNKRQIFNNIIVSFEKSLHLLNTQSLVFYRQILRAMREIRAHYENDETDLTEDNKNYCLILDVVYYWLFRATLYVITGTVNIFLCTIDGLHSKQLVQNNTQYFLSKPGLVKLFQTISMVTRKVDEIYNRFVAFSNPFDNMGEAVRQTKYNIKMLYKEYWNKLMTNWEFEIKEFFHNTNNADIDIIKVHVIGGASFLISFVDYHRNGVQDMRKSVLKIYRRPAFQATVIHIPFQNIWDLCLNWFTNINITELEQPFTLNRWTPHLGTVFTRMDNIDLSRLQLGAGPILP